jgi:hypothetical protein
VTLRVLPAPDPTEASAEPGAAACRARHPSARWSPDLAPLVRRVAASLAAAGRRHPGPAATVVALRGITGLDRAAFAVAAGLAPDRLAQMESGDLDPARWPCSLTHLARVARWEARAS